MYTYINTEEDLSFLNKELLLKPFIGVDTEFRRTTKSNMKLALLQVNDGDEIFLIDALTINEPKDNCEFLFSKSVLKIFHSCKEDLESIFSWTGIKMNSVFDTQLANSFLDSDYSISYQNLVEKKTGVILEKKETRSNWLRRPLSDAQMKYASLDVEYLILLYLEQMKDLKNSEKLAWHNQDIEKLIETTFNPPLLTEFELSRTLPKAQENEMLIKFNDIVEIIAEENRINSTMFFSKKAQKEFLRLVLIRGFESACLQITDWRKDLLKAELLNLFK